MPFLGHATMVKTLRLLIAPFIVLYAVLAVLTLDKVKVHLVPAGASWETFMGGLAFVIVLSGLGWTECGNDYSRYLPANSSRRSIVGWVFLGTALPEIVVMLLGCAVGTYATALSQNSGGDPFAAFTTAHNTVFASWFVVPFLIFAIFQLFSINSLDLYSSGVTLQALGLRVKRWQAVFVDTVICVGLTIYAVFDASFSTLLKDFVDLLVIWIAPWCAIFLVDWVLRRRYSAENLQKTDRSSIYWRSNGVHWPAIIAQLLGMLAALECLAATFSLPKWLHIVNYHFGGNPTPAYGADFSVFAGMLVGGAVYLALAGAKVRREGDAAPVRRSRAEVRQARAEPAGARLRAGPSESYSLFGSALPSPSQSSVHPPSAARLNSGIAPSEWTRCWSSPRAARQTFVSVSTEAIATGSAPTRRK